MKGHLVKQESDKLPLEVALTAKYFPTLVGKELHLGVFGQHNVSELSRVNAERVDGCVSEIISRESNNMDVYLLAEANCIRLSVGVPIRYTFAEDVDIKDYIFVPDNVNTNDGLYLAGIAREYNRENNTFVNNLEHRVEVYVCNLPHTKVKLGIVSL